MSKLSMVADIWTSPFVVIATAVIFGCIAGCAIGELAERRRGGDDQ